MNHEIETEILSEKERDKIREILFSVMQDEDFLCKEMAGYESYKDLLVEKYFPDDEVMQKAICTNFSEEDLVEYWIFLHI